MSAVPTPLIDEEIQRLRAILPKENPVPEEHCHASRGRFTVLCRFRYDCGEQLAWDLTERTVTERAAPGASQSFTFDKVFSPEASQQSVYESVEHVIQGVMSGVNGAILCYGQTSAGKTFTMEGPPGCPGRDLIGIIPRVLTSLFRRVPEVEAEDSTAGYRVHLSMLEIYMERLRDLLADTQAEASALHIVTDRSGLVQVQGLSSIIVGSLEAAMAVFRCGQGRRVVSATNMNSRSSRSHCIFMVHIANRHSSSKLCLADLAGSENLKKAQFKDDVAANSLMSEEAKGINKSLATLSSVIQRLSRDRDEHVPFRDSKLTRVLQDVISGRCKSALIINCSGSQRHSGETLSSLRFGACAQRIASLPAAPDSRAAVLLKTLHTARQEIEQLRVQLQRHICQQGQGLGHVQARAGEDELQQWTPRSLKRCNADELSPLRMQQMQQLTPSKRWDVGRSSSPLSGFTSFPSSRSPSCSRSASLSSARYAAALHRNSGKSSWPPRPPWQARAQVPRIQPVSPLSLSPGPSARPTPRKHVLSQATPLTPEASELACSVVECLTGGVLDREALRPQDAQSWEWPLTRRQQLERKMRTAANHLAQLQHLSDAEEDWLAWLHTGKVQGPSLPTSGGVTPQLLAQKLPELGVLARQGTSVDAEPECVDAPRAASIGSTAEVGTGAGLRKPPAGSQTGSGDERADWGNAVLRASDALEEPRAPLPHPAACLGIRQGKLSTNSNQSNWTWSLELLGSVLQAWRRVVASSPAKQTQLCLWVPSPWQRAAHELCVAWVHLLRSWTQLVAAQEAKAPPIEVDAPVLQQRGPSTRPPEQEEVLKAGSEQSTQSALRDKSGRTGPAELPDGVLQAWRKVTVAAPPKHTQLCLSSRNPWLREPCHKLCNVWAHLIRSFQAVVAQQKLRPAPTGRFHVEPEEPAGITEVQCDLLLLEPIEGQRKQPTGSDQRSRVSPPKLLGGVLQAWHRVAASAPPNQTQLCLWSPGQWQQKGDYNLCSAWAHLMRSWRQQLTQRESGQSPTMCHHLEPIGPAGQRKRLSQPVDQEEELLDGVLQSWHKVATTVPRKQAQLCLWPLIPWQPGHVWLHLFRQLLALQEPRASSSARHRAEHRVLARQGGGQEAPHPAVTPAAAWVQPDEMAGPVGADSPGTPARPSSVQGSLFPLVTTKGGSPYSNTIQQRCSIACRSALTSMGAAAAMLLTVEAAWLCGPEAQLFF